MDYVRRASWGAPPTTPAAVMPEANGVKIHWLGEKAYRTGEHAHCPAKVRAVRKAHLDHPTEGYVDVAYNLLVCGHGSVYEGRGPGYRSGANGNRTLNTGHYAVCALLGVGETPSPELLGGLRDAIDLLQQFGAGPELLGHRDGYATTCPGDDLENWVKQGAPRPAAPETPAPTPPPVVTPPPPPPAPAIPSGPGPGAYLAQGHTGPMVRQLQQRLHDRGWRITVDGDFGPATRAVVVAFQQDSTAHGWPLTADGLVGPKTWHTLWNRPVS
jgi:hypothetical protein